MSDSLADPKPGSGEGALDPGLKRRFQKQPKRTNTPEIVAEHSPEQQQRDSELELRGQQLRGDL
ncbi:MAG: hypothetical protein DBW85_05935 [Synechococcus sp. MED-G71]|nr:MAG: hypothetical protein DBW85_05935 [Synechococcus sp. MED-G71]RPF75617.1 MAG: hypothetical protein CBD15_007955 [Synechococcus sp. TMED155]|tara:strand:- start:3879 stop:4070 length:192 start_codon:yes stop_codon:yes gene_type:complete